MPARPGPRLAIPLRAYILALLQLSTENSKSSLLCGYLHGQERFECDERSDHGTGDDADTVVSSEAQKRGACHTASLRRPRPLTQQTSDRPARVLLVKQFLMIKV
ncbi:hypothetical protein J3458_015608 [Metarhizium acridum]|uniref:uncharacterized protein n=1 Tax=Metarhizium acridum TaxID=92637 RepID=UPI001C6C93FC|nr:hypothetical protein J3458_015608 [Metarhizium acridum]